MMRQNVNVSSVDSKEGGGGARCGAQLEVSNQNYISIAVILTATVHSA